MRIAPISQQFAEAVKKGDISAVISLYDDAKKNDEIIDLNAKINGLTLIEFVILKGDCIKYNSDQNTSGYSQIFEKLKDYGATISATGLLNLYIKHDCQDPYYIQKLISWDKDVQVTKEDLLSVGELPQVLKSTGLFDEDTQGVLESKDLVGGTLESIE